MNFVSAFKNATARVFLLSGMLGPAIALLVAPHHWTTSKILEQVLHLPVGLTCAVLAVVLIIGVILVLFKKFRDFGYICGAAFYVFLIVVALAALFSGLTTSLLVLALPVLVWIYMTAAVTSSKRLYGNKEDPEGGQ